MVVTTLGRKSQRPQTHYKSLQKEWGINIYISEYKISSRGHKIETNVNLKIR